MAFPKLRCCILFALLFIYSTAALAQRDIYNWEWKAYGGFISNGKLEVPSGPALYASGMRIQKNLGAAWQLGLHLGHFNFGQSSFSERSYSGLGLAYNWDNGKLLHKRAFVSPYHLVESGYLAQADFNDKSFENETAALGLENGLKFRIGDRATAHLAYAVFWEVDRGGVESTFERSALNLWKVGVSLHFGEKKVRFRGPTFDAGARFSPVGNSAFQSLAADSAATAMPPQMASRIDTVYSFRVDTVFKVVKESVFIDSTGTPQYASGVSEREYRELQARLVYLEGFMEGKSRKDTTIIVYRTEIQPQKAGETPPSQDETEVERSAVADSFSQRSSNGSAVPADTDPVIIAMLERQEELIRTQNAMLREMNARSAQPVAVEQPRNKRMRTQVSPTIMVPLNDPGSNRDNERVALLEEQVKKLEERILAMNTPAPAAPAAPAPALTVVPVIQPQSETAPAEIVEPEAPAPVQKPITSYSADSISQRAMDIQQKANDIALARTGNVSTSAKTKAEYPAVFLFGLNQDDVAQSYGPTFDDIAADLNADARRRARISGFTDKSGNAEYNKKLSARRAASIKRHLLERGVSESQIQVIAEGASGATDKFSPGDRRVEVELVGGDQQ